MINRGYKKFFSFRPFIDVLFCCLLMLVAILFLLKTICIEKFMPSSFNEKMKDARQAAVKRAMSKASSNIKKKLKKNRPKSWAGSVSGQADEPDAEEDKKDAES